MAKKLASDANITDFVYNFLQWQDKQKFTTITLKVQLKKLK